MSKYSEGFELFLKGYSGDLGCELAGKIVERFGSEDCFLNNYEKVCESGMVWAIDGWIQTSGLATFFEENRKLFMDFMKASIRHTEYKSVAELVATLSDTKKVYSTQQITEALNSTKSEHYKFVAAAIAKYSSEVLSKYYMNFLKYHADGTSHYGTKSAYDAA
ncbi:MAG: hypothetical protein J6N72_02255 [Psychrobacter sp.]|nr:hypothetical protein [Psychrobacter sp.]